MDVNVITLSVPMCSRWIGLIYPACLFRKCFNLTEDWDESIILIDLMDWINRVTYEPSRMGNAKKKTIQLKGVVSNWFEEDKFPFWSWGREKEGMRIFDVRSVWDIDR